jgi:subtilisin family serine protease
MKSLRASVLVALCMAITACAQMTPRNNAAAAGTNAPDRQILVMLRSTPPHFRPYMDYTPGYDARVPHGAQWRIAEDLAQQFALKLVTDWPMPALGVDCFVLEAPSREGIARLVDEIARDARVESAQAMHVFQVLAHNDPLYPLQPSARLWHLAEVHKVTTGRDVRIAEVDTGVEVDHPDLRGRITVARDFVGTPAKAGEAHGTAVAGIIAARADDGIGIAGIAPDAKLFALRACWQMRDQSIAACTSFTLAKALQFALDQDVQVINLSLGGPRDYLLERLLDVGLARHIIIVSAADPRVSGGGFPASHRGVLAVASEGAENPPAGALLAPGNDVPATTVDRSWGFVNGSSYAAAQVSGAVALLLERAPALDAARVRSVLTSGMVANAGIDRPAMVDVCSAVALTTGACVCGCVVVARDANPNPAH